MKSIFISIPMNGRDEETIRAEMAILTIKVEEHLREKVIVLESFLEEFKETNIKNKPVFYLAHSIKELSRADIAVFAGGWEEARGCAIEHTIAEKYGIPILHETELARG